MSAEEEDKESKEPYSNEGERQLEEEQEKEDEEPKEEPTIQVF
jgi:hypothetical protein